MNDNGHNAQEVLSPWDDPMLGSDLDLTEVRQLARESGIDLSLPSIQRAIATRRQAAGHNNPPAPSAAYVKFQNGMIAIGTAITTAAMLLISNILLPLSIVGLGVAEYARVQAGIATFDPARSKLLALVAVVFYAGLLVVYSDKINGAEITRDKFSLRLVWRKLKYFVGIGKFRPQQITTVTLLERALAADGMLIILLGTLGSLQEEIKVTGTWHHAIYKLLIKSDLPTFVTLAGGISITAGLLFGWRFLIDFQRQHYRKLLPEGAGFFIDSGANTEVGDRAEMEFLLAKIRQKQQAG